MVRRLVAITARRRVVILTGFDFFAIIFSNNTCMLFVTPYLQRSGYHTDRRAGRSVMDLIEVQIASTHMISITNVG